MNSLADLLLAAMSLNIESDGRSTDAEEFVPGQPESDQQNVLHPSVKCRGYLAQ
ncbi:Uncharacterised protein [Mycobacteroides abscessus subsp. abscessus]|nr:Uncharacterised protein [Mycobacteroides abscessus subsp. abscessus]SKH84657.1 Uncharacterised protein [Mycobacteroides abscessus subsp. abscessus]SKY22938.1 Uncharacterised protein [Mycobacteroides abscessus subsp. abscessus]